MSEIYAAERYESLVARDSAPLWAFESRAEAEGFDLAAEMEGRR